MHYLRRYLHPPWLEMPAVVLARLDDAADVIAQLACAQP